MTCINIYKQCAQITYKSTICSKATLFIILTFWVRILLTYLLAYGSGGLWLKHEIFYEQPDIKFTHEYIFIAETNHFHSVILCSNMVQFQKENDYGSCSSVKVREIDENADGKFDKLNFNLQVQVPENSGIRSIKLVLMLDYKIHTICPLHFQPSAIVQTIYNGPGMIMHFNGDVILSQASSLPCPSQEPFTNYNKPIVDLQDVIINQLASNFSTRIANQHIFWTVAEHQMFELQLQLRYPEQAIRYKPSTLQVLKYAWIHYLAIFIPITWIINKIKSYVFTNRLVTCRKEIKNKMD